MSTCLGRYMTRRELVKTGEMLAAALALEASNNILCAGQTTAGGPASTDDKAKGKKMAVTGISSIWFGVTDWQRAKAFYEKVLGLRPTFVNDETGWAAYSANATDPPIFLVKRRGASSKHIPNAAKGENHGGTLGFNAANAAEIMKHVAAYGGSVSDHVQDGTDSKVFTIYDPDGNVLELTEMKKA